MSTVSTLTYQTAGLAVPIADIPLDSLSVLDFHRLAKTGYKLSFIVYPLRVGG